MLVAAARDTSHHSSEVLQQKARNEHDFHWFSAISGERDGDTGGQGWTAACRKHGDRHMAFYCVDHPVCLIKWLAGVDRSEVEIVAAEERQLVSIFERAAKSKQHVLELITEWAEGNDSAQGLHIAAHGLEHADEGFVGLYDGKDTEDWLSWLELASHLVEHVRAQPVVWLGACGSATAMPIWSEFVLQWGHLPAAWVVAFDGGVHRAVVEATLRQAMRNMRLEPLVFIEEELQSLRDSAGEAVRLFYPAHAKDTKRNEYVDVEAFEARVGRSFADFMKDRKT